MPRSHSSGSSMSSAVARPVAAYVVGGVEHQEAPALAEPGARCPGRVAQRPVDDGRVDRLVGVVADHPAAAYDVLRTPWASMTGEPCLTTSSRCGATSRPLGRSAASGGYFRQPFTPVECELRAWFVEQCAARGLEVEADGNGNLLAWWTVGSTPVDTRRRRADRLPPRLGPRRRGVRRTAGRGLLAGRDRPAPGARGACRAGRSRSGRSPRRRGRASGSPASARGWPPASTTPEAARELRDRDGVPPARRDGRAPASTRRSAAPTGSTGSAASWSCTSSRAATWSTATRRSGWPREIWPHGRYRFDFTGDANHAGTTRMEDRHDPMLSLRDDRAGGRASRPGSPGSGRPSAGSTSRPTAPTRSRRG